MKDITENVTKYAQEAFILDEEACFAEFGVFEGNTAEAICKVKGDRPLHLFDTFEGLPEEMFSAIDKTVKGLQYLHVGDYCCSLEKVQERLKEYPNVHYYKGLFPDTVKDFPKTQFCFVHLDSDLFNSIYEGIFFFYPQLINDGIMLIHNYDDFEGVRAAVQLFFEPEEVERVGSKHCLIRKT